MSYCHKFYCILTASLLFFGVHDIVISKNGQIERLMHHTMKFKLVADYFSNIEQEPSRIGMTKLLAELFEQATPKEAGMLAYLSLGMLRPPYQGFQFNLAKKNLILVVADLLGETPASISAQEKNVSDLGALLDAWENVPATELALVDVYEQLQHIESISGAGSVEDKIQAAINLCRQLDPLAAKYVLRIILGTLRLGFSDMTIIDALSWMQEGNKSLRAVLEHAYNISADIGLLAETIKHNKIPRHVF